MSEKRGTFIVLDGPEGSGKSTQSRLLREALTTRGLEVVGVRDPGATPIGEKIRAILLDTANTQMTLRCEMLLYMAARAQMMGQLIAPALEAGRVVVCDRFVSSTLAYQGSAGEGADVLLPNEILDVARIATGGRLPDLTLILDIAPQRGFERVRREKDRIEQRPLAYHQRVRQGFLDQAKTNPTYRVIDADQPEGAVHEAIVSAVDQAGLRFS